MADTNLCMDHLFFSYFLTGEATCYDLIAINMIKRTDI